MIFCFGSNLAGRHGAGAAKVALKLHGAIYGRGFGLQGNSFAIPTKDANIQTMPLNMIEHYIEKFLQFAREHPEMDFNLTPIGTGLAGHKKIDILTILKKYEIPDNVYFNRRWIQE